VGRTAKQTNRMLPLYYSALHSSQSLTYLASRSASTGWKKIPLARCLTGSVMPSALTCAGSAISNAFLLLWP